jgi:hypothetical protein
METFAAQPRAQTLWSRDVALIQSNEARVMVTALIIKDSAQPPQRMCGVRMDLANQKATDQVYLEEAQLEPIKRALEVIEIEVETFRKEPDSTPYRYRGAAEFWHPELKVQLHTLNAAYYLAPDSAGLSLSAYKNQQFRFPNHRPAELAQAIGRAIDELKKNCSDAH